MALARITGEGADTENPVIDVRAHEHNFELAILLRARQSVDGFAWLR
jgi:hypothetical protein